MAILGASSLSPRDRRTLVLGVGTVLALVITFRGLPAWRRWIRETRESAAELSSQLIVARQITTSARQIQLAADSLETAYLGVAPSMLPGDTPAQAASSLASYVTDAAVASGVRLGSVQLAVDSADTASAGNEIYHIRVNADGAGDVRGIVAFLRMLETSAAPLLAVRTVSISQADPAAPGNRPEELHTTFTIEGLARRELDP